MTDDDIKRFYSEQTGFDLVASEAALLDFAHAIERAVRRAALEEAAAVIEPKRKRPCDCDVCDCGNAGDMRDVAWWDEATANANRIRALAYGDTK